MTLETSNLSKRYGNKWVLRDASLKLEKGRVLGLFGATGSGKRTLLRILANEEPQSPPAPTGLNGYSVVLHTTQDTTFFKRIFERSDRSTDGVLTGLEKTLDRANDVLLIDDPLVEIDAGTRELTLDVVRKAVKEKDLVAVYATSDFETAALVSDEIAVLDGGTITQVGTAEEIYETPLTRNVAILSGRCNLIEARRLTSSKSDIPEFQTIAGGHRLFAEKADIAKLGSINKNVVLAIRPENISVSFGASFPEDNLLKTVVTGIKFLGTTTLVEFDAGGLSLEVCVFRVVGLKVGDECMLGLPPERIKILRD
jgi:ABC-type Fe3+/spermidine/putrescine transport system ATPase subunit